MKKISKYILAFIGVMLITINMAAIGAYGYTDYTTDNYNVNVKVQENNSYLIQQKITVDFQGAHHGIYCYINNDGVLIDKVNVDNEEFESYTEDGNTVVQIGSEDVLVSGKHTYTMSYRMRVYDDKDTSLDKMLIDVIPTNWETAIKKAHVSIQMPKKTDLSGISIIAAKYGDYTTDNSVSYTVDTSKNRVLINGVDMAKGVGVTASLELPEGYWQDQLNTDWVIPLIGIILIVGPLLILLLWFLFGRDPKVVRTVEFYPPEGITPAEVGFLIDGVVDQKDIVSMIMYYADKGYLTIKEYKKNRFELTKTGELPDSEKAYSKVLFDGIFAQGDTIRLDDLDEEFGESYLTAKELLEGNYSGKNRVFSLKSELSRLAALFLSALPAVICTSLAMYYDHMGEASIFGLLIFIPILLGAVLVVSAYDKKYAISKAKMTGRMILALIVLFIGMAIAGVLVGYLLGKILYGIALFISTAACVFISMFMKARTKKSAELLGKILGLKEFIRVAELPKIKLLVEENPEYFYNVVPYAYVLGLSNKWVKNFEGIPTQPPRWYGGYDNSMFNTFMFMSMMNHCGTSFGNNIHISIPEGGDTGGFGGGGFGGFSGGGFGGGGGGAW